ncbi:MAG TPA: hypothetical protein VD767_01775 [Thermomicrobiales bacterium]|nr:hypothetical protein [Thermomicrobiales bacterium]
MRLFIRVDDQGGREDAIGRPLHDPDRDPRIVSGTPAQVVVRVDRLIVKQPRLAGKRVADST